MDFKDLTNSRLSRLFQIDELAVWEDADGAEALRHQLRAPMLADLERVCVAPGDVRRLAEFMARRNMPESQSFGEHLTAPCPILEVLVEVKHFARLVHGDASNPLRGMPATALYYGAVAAALVGCNTRVTRLSDKELVTGWRWAITQHGGEALVGLFKEALKRMKGVRVPRPSTFGTGQTLNIRL